MFVFLLVGAITLVGSILTAISSRMCGSGQYYLPYGLDQFVYSIPHGFAAYIALGGVLAPVWSIPLSLVVYGLTVLSKRTGHGNWFDLGTSTEIVEPEKLDVIVNALYGKDPNFTKVGSGDYWHDFFGLMVSGVAINLGLTLAFLFSFHPVLAIVTFLMGCMKAVSYAIGWKIIPEGYRVPLHYPLSDQVNEPSELGELLTGFCNSLPAVAFIAYWMVTTL